MGGIFVDGFGNCYVPPGNGTIAAVRGGVATVAARGDPLEVRVRVDLVDVC